MDVDRVLSTLDQQLPAGASASWFDAGAPPPDLPPRTAASGTAGPGPSGPARRAPSAPVADLLAGLADVLARVGGDFAAGGTDLLVETAGRTVLVRHVDEAGALVVEAGKGLNLALVRRLVINALEDAGGAPLPAEPVVRLPARPAGTERSGGIAAAFPRRSPTTPVTDFGYVPEDAEVLRLLAQALSQ